MKKLLIFLMIAIPLVVILVVNLTVNAVAGMVSISVESISLNQTEISATIDDVVTLEATILPKNATNKDIKWESTNESVAKVDLNGNVTFVGFGGGYITAITVDGHKMATCYFYATDTEVHQVKIVSEQVQDGNYYVGINKTLLISSEILPMEAVNKDVIYTSEDESIATVDSNGLIKGVKEGRVKITSTSESDNSISDSVIVEVVKPVQRVVVSSKNAVTSSSTYQLSYGVYPEDASVSKVTYKSSDEQVAVVGPSGLVTFLKPGKVMVTLTSVEGQKTAEVEVEYTDGYATDLILDKNTINASVNEGGTYISYSTIPQNVDVDVEFLSDDENVAYVDDSGYIQFMGGGNTLIHARIKKSSDEYIEKIVGVFVESPATRIILDDEYIIAQKTLKLSPSSYPQNSTNDKYFFASKDLGVAIVDEKGNVTFVRDEYCVVDIDVFANEAKDVHKSVRVTYTNGLPEKLTIEKDKYFLDFGDVISLEYGFYPENINISKAELLLDAISQNQNDGGNKVVEILQDGSIKAVGGGVAVLGVSCLNYNGNRISKQIEITVSKKVEDVEFVTDLEIYNNEYYTCNQTVSFDIRSLTSDATNQSLSWSLKSSVAIKSGLKEIKFNNAGIAEITIKSEDLNTEKRVVVRYIKSNLVDATINEFEKEIEVGNIEEIYALSVFPANGSKNISLRVTNQITSSEVGKVLEVVDKNKIKAVAGGSATLIVTVSNLQFNYSIKTIRKAEQITVAQAGIKTTKDRLLLRTEVLPVDTTDTRIIFEVLNDNIAEIDGDYVVFKQDGIANIRVLSVDGGTQTEFTVEKIAKGTGEITSNGEPITMLVGDTNIIKLSNIDFDYLEDAIDYQIIQNPVEEGNEVISFNEDEKIIEALNFGSAKINCILTNSNGIEITVSFDVDVICISENIEFNTNLEIVQRDYVTALQTVDLEFDLLPQFTTNKKCTTRIVEFVKYNQEDQFALEPTIEDNLLIFRSAGTAVVEVKAEDGGVSKKFRIRFTDGNAIDATLNIENYQNENQEVILDVGDEFEIALQSLIPQNATNKTFKVREISHSQDVVKVLEISEKTLRAIAGGWSNIRVEISDGVVKDFRVVVTTKITKITLDDEIITAYKSVTLNPVIEPQNATIKNLRYEFTDESCQNVATITGSTITFEKAGEVEVKVSTLDGSNISRYVVITSTFGYVKHFDLITTKKTVTKGRESSLAVKTYYPQEATELNFNYKIVSNITNDGSSNAVVEVSPTGIIKGTYGGVAVVRVYTIDFYGEEIYVDCIVNVLAPISYIEVDFDRELQMLNGYYTTAQDELEYSLKISPQDARIENISISSSDEKIAVVFDDKIVFKKEGFVSITFSSTDSDASVTKLFRYSKSLLSARVDESDFINKNIGLDAGSSYKINILEYNPIDISKIEFVFENIVETRIDQNLEVVSFNSEGTISALNGGKVWFNLKINGLDMGRYCVEVFRKCNQISVNKTEVYIKSLTYQIEAITLPSDTYQTELKYEIVEANSNASVSENGEVKLNGSTRVVVKVSLVDNSEIYEYVTVIYSNDVQRLNLECPIDTIFFGYSADINIKPEPFGVDEFEFEYFASDNDMVKLRLLDSKTAIRVTAKEKGGQVTITVKVKGKEISAQKTFSIEAGVSEIKLELDNREDEVGIAGHRVWGKSYLSKEFAIINTYQMQVKSIKPEAAFGQVPLIWTSSDEGVATVDENGLVTFITPGIVTISVEPLKQARKDYKAIDSYTFKVIEGVNIFSEEEFSKIVSIDGSVCTPRDVVVLHTDLNPKKQIKLYRSFFGNGHVLNFTGAGDFERVKIDASNVWLDNVEIYAGIPENFKYLSQLEYSQKGIKINSHGEKFQDVKITNTKVQYAMIGIEVGGVDLLISGCVVRDTLSSGLIVERDVDYAYSTTVTVENSVFANSLFGSILFVPEQNPSNVNYRAVLTIKENVYLFNWLKLREFTYDNEVVRRFIPDVSEQVQDLIGSGNFDNYIYTDPQTNEKYIMIGIIADMDIDPSAAGVSLDDFKFKSYGDVYSNGIKNPNSILGYVKASVAGNIRIGANVIGANIKVATADCRFKIYTQTKSTNGVIKTIDIDVTRESIVRGVYYDDAEMYAKIRYTII